MFQFNFQAGKIRLAIRPILKLFLLTGSWENSYKTAFANLRSLQILLCPPSLTFKFAGIPLHLITYKDDSFPQQQLCYY